MHISAPAIRETDGRPVLYAAVGADTPGVNLPDELWFSPRDGYADELSTLGDAFLAGLLPVAMTLGEPLHIEGPVSARLAHGAWDYQHVLTTWYPRTLKVVDVRYDQIVDRDADPRPAGVGCSFSGGADSFYTLVENLPDRQPVEAYRMTHALMINGFDKITDFKGDGYSERLGDTYRPLLAALGVKLVMIDANVKAFRDVTIRKQQLIFSFGSPLTACAHALGGLWGRFSLSGHTTYAHEAMAPCGVHPALDHLLGSDQLQLMHSGAEALRTERLARLADIPQVQASLRVCNGPPRFDDKTGGVANCCRCAKCNGTMVVLELLGKLEHFETFNRRCDLEDYRRPEVLGASSAWFVSDMLQLARRVNRPEWVEALEGARRLQDGVA